MIEKEESRHVRSVQAEVKVSGDGPGSELTNFAELSQILKRGKEVALAEILHGEPAPIWKIDSQKKTPPIEINLEQLKANGFSLRDSVDLVALPPGSLIYFVGFNSHAFYSLEKRSESVICVWRDRAGGKTTGLVAEPAAIQIIDQESVNLEVGHGIVYPGCLISASESFKKPRILMPYFRYAEDGSVILPGTPKNQDSWWSDYPQFIYVKDG